MNSVSSIKRKERERRDNQKRTRRKDLQKKLLSLNSPSLMLWNAASSARLGLKIPRTSTWQAVAIVHPQGCFLQVSGAWVRPSAGLGGSASQQTLSEK